jgi:hypothetical protein
VFKKKIVRRVKYSRKKIKIHYRDNLRKKNYITEGKTKLAYFAGVKVY